MKKIEVELFTFNCIGCGKCVSHCKQGVLKMVDNGMCRFVNVVDETRCLGDGLCENICPKKAIKITRNRTSATSDFCFNRTLIKSDKN